MDRLFVGQARETGLSTTLSITTMQEKSQSGQPRFRYRLQLQLARLTKLPDQTISLRMRAVTSSPPEIPYFECWCGPLFDLLFFSGLGEQRASTRAFA